MLSSRLTVESQKETGKNSKLFVARGWSCTRLKGEIWKVVGWKKLERDTIERKREEREIDLQREESFVGVG